MAGPGRHRGKGAAAVALVAAALLAAPLSTPGRALDRVDFAVSTPDDGLTRTLRAASLLLAQVADGATDPQDLFAAARADYARLLGALYAEGHYGAVISIRIDGREAAAIAPLDAPGRIGAITVTVDPGPRFAFSKAEVTPLSPGTTLPRDFRVGEAARAGSVEDAVAAGILGWREAGHAKARVAGEDIIADHATARLAATVRLEPGPALRFGPVSVTGAERMRVNRILKIAGLREGEAFSQSELDRAAARLRRTGVFSSVTLSEGENILNGGLLPIEVTVAEQKPRRYSIGGEVASLDGLSLGGYWLHRNLMGGGERLKLEGSLTNIGSGESGIDWEIGVTIDRPATLTPDTTAQVSALVGHLDEIDYAADYGEVGLSFLHYLSLDATLRAGLRYEYAEGSDPGGDFLFRNLSLPLGVTWDRRDSATDARKGFYLDAELKPFLGFGTTGSGARLAFDGRAYRSFGTDDRITLAARVQGGAIFGSSLLETPRDDLFFSGGGGTVRGQPYRSLGILVNRGLGSDFLIGGTYMLAGSLEVRARVTQKVGVVGFVDAGRVAVDGFFDDLGDWHAGAGLGLRYETGFGPLRLDVAAPVGGGAETGDGVQVYIGLGQSF